VKRIEEKVDETEKQLEKITKKNEIKEDVFTRLYQSSNKKPSIIKNSLRK
jgi:hypothetical protein